MNPSPYSLEPQIAAVEHSPAAPTVADIPVKLAAARQAAYSDVDATPHRLNFPALLFIGMVLFILFFVVGYYLATIVVHR
jgi:hypothetical protein